MEGDGMKELIFRRGYGDLRDAEHAALHAILREHEGEFNDADVKKLRVVAWPLGQGVSTSRYDVMFKIKTSDGAIGVVAAIRLEDDTFQELGYLFETFDSKFKLFVLRTAHNGFFDLLRRTPSEEPIEGILQFNGSRYEEVGTVRTKSASKRKVKSAKKSKSNRSSFKKPSNKKSFKKSSTRKKTEPKRSKR